MKKYIFLYFLLISLSLLAQEKFTLSGYVTEEGSQELLIGAEIYVPQIKQSVVSNNYGYYSISLPKGDYDIICTLVGYQEVEDHIELNQNQILNISLSNHITLKEVVASAENSIKQSKSAQMSEVKIPIAQIKRLPSLLGEKDVLKALQLTPGVQSGAEGSSGLYVRGGGPDQNLLILDDAPVYNASHLFGFFSIFNGDAIKNINLIKGGFPACYGGRLSSVLDVSMKDGNKEKFGGEVGLGLLSSRLILEGPLVKNKSSFIISARRTYVDFILTPLMDEDEKMKYYFYDLNAKINYEFNQRNKLYLSGYFGKDYFRSVLGDDYGESKGKLFWGNATATLRWNHLFNDKIFSNTSLIFSDYNFNVYSSDKFDDGQGMLKSNYFYESKYQSSITDLGLKYDMQFNISPQYLIRAGANAVLHNFKPSAISIKDESEQLFNHENTVEKIKTTEANVYMENEWSFYKKFKMNAGLRLSNYLHKNKTYTSLEPRVSLRYSLTDDLSIKASYATMNQYIHLLTSAGISLPMDLWVTTTDRVKPQHAEQFALGISKDWNEQKIGISLEGYYKKMNDLLGYAPGASFLLNNLDLSHPNREYSWEENVIHGQGWAYGLEFFVQKKVGKFSGWAGYTLAWVQHQFDEDNKGKKYFARYDRRHDISLVGFYDITKNISLSGTWVYGTGNAVSLPKSSYFNLIDPLDSDNPYANVYAYGSKNDLRMRAYHRLDLAIQFKKITKRKRKRIWEIGVYNAYSRKNPFFYQYADKEIENPDGSSQRKVVLNQYSIFPIIPSISYSLKF
ncbi:TonB-dependent receptor [Ornithobacterium rhinotracheale]|uniref:TonB-dependent receptor n=1 Tax=Ornithobacterium rhinotracheale TaxID=28251 RepID=UPI00129C5C21|nr:TonB-dependent receptor [Ornithobacterium rhinotracheale]MRJ08972.1 TonB-dependent receptor [Ornithobacterium rhinotracheale]UOH78870.1 TonB-dependent receptor [Ornithobacterium rhinotracheale]